MKGRPARTYLGHIIFLVVAALMAYYYARLRWIMNGEFENGSLENLMNGTADKVFQYRMLVPWLVPLIDSAAPAALKSWLSVKSVFDWFRVVEAVSAFGLLVSFRYYISFFVGGGAVSFITPFLLFYALPYNFLWPPVDTPIEFPLNLPVFAYYGNHFSLYYPYDTLSMAFFTLGLILIYKRKWAPYYLLFAVATFNRETTCFLTFVYLFTAWGREKKKIMLFHCGLQLIIWVAIKFFLYRLYFSNPSTPFGYKLLVNIELFSTKSNWYFMLSNMGFLWVPVLFFWRRIREDFVRRSLLVVVPFLAGSFMIGVYTELRWFGDALPVVASAFVMILKALFENAGEGRPAPQAR